MNRGRNRNKFLAFFSAILLVILAMAQPVLASGTGTIKKGSLTFEFKYDEQVIEGVEYKLYQVGTIDSNGFLDLTHEYWSQFSYADNVDASASVKEALAQSMVAGLVNETSVTPIATATSDADGNVVFTNLDEGYYLGFASDVVIGESVYKFGPTLLVLKAAEGEDTFDIIGDPKIGSEPKAPEDTEHTVKKVWSDAGNESSRPTEIKVQLIKNNEENVGDPVVLNADNEWTYTWTNLSKSEGETYTVTELEVPSGYTKIENTNTETLITTITNEKTTPTPTPPTPTTTRKVTPTPKKTTTTPTRTPERLPQTGVLWWPVPVLFGAGLLLYGIGWVIDRRKNKQ